MVSRLNRNRPLPEVRQPRVNESVVQRAFDGLFEPLRSVVEFLQPFVQPEKWKPLPYYGTASDLAGGQVGQYKKDPFGHVWIRAEMTDSSSVADHCIAVLPAGYRPPYTIRLLYDDATGVTPGGIEINAAGEILYKFGSTVTMSLHVSFDPAGVE